jgi:hypothetical protein
MFLPQEKELYRDAQFVSTYLCENGFSNFAATKTKYRSSLNADLRIELSYIKPNMKIICEEEI